MIANEPPRKNANYLGLVVSHPFCDRLKLLFCEWRRTCEWRRILGPNEISLPTGVLLGVLASETVQPFLHHARRNWLPRDA